jgi:hypothetical protein
MEKLEAIFKDKKTVGIGVLIFFTVFLIARRKQANETNAPNTNPNNPLVLPGSGSGGSSIGALPTPIQPVAEVLSLVFDLDNSVQRDNELSYVESGGSGSSGSGAIRLGPFSIGGGGGKSSTSETGYNSKTSTNIANVNRFAFSGSGSSVGNLLTTALDKFTNLIGNSTQRDAQQTRNLASANQTIGNSELQIKSKNNYVVMNSFPGAKPQIPQNTGLTNTPTVLGTRWNPRTRRMEPIV